MNKKKLFLYFLLYFCFAISINIVHPVTPDYIKSLEMPEFYFGILYSLMSLGQVLGAFFFGFLSDKIGRKGLIIMGIFGYCLAQLGFGFINTYPILMLVFRALSGIFISAPNTLFISMILDYSDKETNVKNLMIMSFCNLLGMSVGYAIGGALYSNLGLSIQQVFLVQLGIGSLTALIFGLTIYDKKQKVLVKGEKTKSKFSFKNFKHLNGLIYLLLGSLLVLTIGQVLIHKYLDPYFIDLGHKASELGNYVLITGIIGAFSNLAFIPLIKKAKNKSLAILLTSFIFTSVILTFITFLLPVNIMYLLFSTHLVYICLKALIMPLEQNEIASYATDQNYGQIMGARHTIISMGNVLGPLLGSLIYVSGSPIIFVTAASILFVSLVLYIVYFILKHHKETKSFNEQLEKHLINE